MSAETYLADRVEDLVHRETQVHGGGVDLTVAEVYTVADPGRVDFGGGELTAAELSACETHLRNPDDDYGWWHLDGGGYLVEFNERLTGDEPVVLTTRDELRERGAAHPTMFTADLGRVPLSVVEGGVRLKENARVSTLRLAP